MQCAFLSRNFSLQSRTVNFSFVISSIGFAYYVGPFLCLPVRRGFKSLNAFKMHVIFHCTWSYGSLLNVSSVTFHLPENLQRKKQRISDFFGMVSVWLFPSICLSSEIHIFKQKMCKCSIVRDTIWSSQLKWSSFLIFESAYTNR